MILLLLIFDWNEGGLVFGVDAVFCDNDDANDDADNGTIGGLQKPQQKYLLIHGQYLVL